MSESPLFAKLKSEGKTSSNPLKESFRKKANFKMVLLALFGAVMGQGVIWYTGQFYAQSFLENSCRLDFEQSRSIMLWAIALGTPFFLLFGWLSDKWGRKYIMMTGMLLGILLYRPIFSQFLQDSNIKEWVKDSDNLQQKTISSDTIQLSDPAYRVVEEKIQFRYAGNEFTGSLRDTLVFKGANNPSSSPLSNGDETGWVKNGGSSPVYSNLSLSSTTYWKFVGLVFVMIIFVTMVYGPIAAFLVEMFPTRIRYTSMSLPYHIGNGVFGGLVPFIGLLLSSSFPSDPLVGLWYPIGVAAICLLIGLVYLRNKIDPNVND
jgi:MFS family permease